MGELTDGLLSLAHLSRTSLELNTVSLTDEATNIIRQLSENDPNRVLGGSVAPGLLVRADRALLRQVLQNLIANAWKFSSKKEHAEIFVGMERDAEQQPVYFVRDNGAGFDMAYADKLFGTFQRLHSPEEFSGSGIGLATVKRIISRHGGKVWAQSVLGQGSTFYFTLGQEQSDSTRGGVEDDSMTGATLSEYARQQWLLEQSEGASAGAGAEMSGDDNLHAGFFGTQLFSNAFEHSATGMTVIGLDARRLKVNNAFCRMMGYSEAEMMSRTIYELTHPDDIEADLAHRKRALAGEIEAYQFEKRYIHQSGRIVWGYTSTSLLRDADRKPLYFIAQVQDMTERKNAERILKASDERFRELTALSSDWFWEQDEKFRFKQIVGESPFFGANTGNNSLGKTRWELDYVGMDVHAMAAHKAQLERHEVFHNFEVSRMGQNGKVRHVSLSGVPIFDETGRFTGYRGIGRDNTEMRRVADALRASEAMLREITDNLPAMITYTDADQIFRFHNRAFAEAFGGIGAQINGKHVREVMGDAFYEVVRPRIEETLSGYPVVYERIQKTERGELRDFLINYFPRYGDRDSGGKVLGFFTLGTDITELKRIEHIKSEFVSTVSHELRTPLTSIRGSLGLLTGGVAGQLPDAAAKLVLVAQNNCERLIRLINDMLDIEKIEAGKMRMNLQPLEFNPLVGQALAANEGAGVARNVRLKLVFQAEDVRVYGDSDRLTQVITNLLSNAMKFSASGETVEIYVSRSGLGVRTEVRDHGPGISEEFRKRIFQKFSQADSSDSRQQGGTGLGLNISRAIIERMGVVIGFHSNTGVGSTFFFELPEYKGLAGPPAVSAEPVVANPRD